MEPRLVCVSRLSPEKGHLTLLRAVARLVSSGLSVTLVLIGDGPLRPEVEEQIAALRLNHCITVRGWAPREVVRDEILKSRALVLPSFAEGLPVALMEALALGRPVISTFVGGIPELVGHGECGWLVPPSSVSRLASAMSEAITAPVARLESMGKTGARLVSDRHNAAKEASRLADLFALSIARAPGRNG